MSGSSAEGWTAGVRAAVTNLARDAAGITVIEALAAEGIPSVVLKGAALSDWYPAGSTRTYVDTDIWIPPDAQALAAVILANLGFRHAAEQVDGANPPKWFSHHETTWRRDSDGCNIDLHRRLQGMMEDPLHVWEMLWPRTETFAMADREAKRLHTPARALYVTLHAAGHGAGFPEAQRHLHAALDSLDRSGWVEAARLAHELDAVDMFASGLRLVPGGRELAAELDLPAVTSVQAALYSITPPPLAFSFEELASKRGVGGRLKYVLSKFFPPPGFIRHWWSPAAQNRLMLMVGYLYRPIWLLRRTPAGWRAWQAARRVVAEQQRGASGQDPSEHRCSAHRNATRPLPPADHDREGPRRM